MSDRTIEIVCKVEMYATMTIGVEDLIYYSIQEFVENHTEYLELRSGINSVDIDSVVVKS
tara:strand:+ start:2049 stop:2228 length:180 start_codon:yes stop_codon:yes gene_type:complete